MNIDRVPYTYLIGWSNQDVWYYGRQTAKGCSPDNLWKTYFTSSKYVREFREQHGDPDVIQVRKTFSCVKKCRIWESKVLQKFHVSKDSRWLNVKEGDDLWDRTGLVSVKDKSGKTFTVATDDPRYASGELVHAIKGIPKSYRAELNFGPNGPVTKGHLGKKHSVEARQKIAEKAKQRPKRVMSEETKLKISMANKGRKKSAEHIKNHAESLKRHYESKKENNRDFG